MNRINTGFEAITIILLAAAMIRQMFMRRELKEVHDMLKELLRKQK